MMNGLRYRIMLDTASFEPQIYRTNFSLWSSSLLCFIRKARSILYVGYLTELPMILAFFASNLDLRYALM